MAICLRHAHANPDHDRGLRAVLLSQRPCLTSPLSSEVSPEARKFDRLSTTVENAYFLPLMQGCHGQGQEIEITLSDRDLEPADLPALIQPFGTAHARPFSRPVPGMEIEVLNGAVRVETVTPPAPTPRGRRPDRPARLFRNVTAQMREAGVANRGDLVPDDHLSGPLLITEPQTTCFVAADFTVRVDVRGKLVVARKGG